MAGVCIVYIHAGKFESYVSPSAGEGLQKNFLILPNFPSCLHQAMPGYVVPGSNEDERSRMRDESFKLSLSFGLKLSYALIDSHAL